MSPARPPLSAPPSLRPALGGWPHAESPFHDGERLAQARAGVGGKLEAAGRRMIRAFMPDEHRELFEKLPYLVAGAADDAGQPWATLLTGVAGFVRTPDEHTLQIAALPHPADPMAPLITAGRPIGLLGIELATRRRNRANGEIVEVQGADAGDAATTASGEPASRRGFSVAVRQSFGNCPQYIQARQPLARRPPAAAPAAALAALADAVAQGATLDAAAAAIVRKADTLFLATATPPGHTQPSSGVDVSHRGGLPGFVALEQRPGATVLTLPDYRGNYLFNSVGNLEQNPRAGLLFPDFATGDLLSLTAEVTVVWDDVSLAAFAAAATDGGFDPAAGPVVQRLLVVRVLSGVRLPAVLPWRWSAVQLAPQLAPQ